MLAGVKRSIDLPVPVRDSPHWRLVLRPETFERERIKTLKECWQLMESCRVVLRGRDFPHVDRVNRSNANDWIASWCELIGQREYWRLYQSGQFVHLFSFLEDVFREAYERRAQPTLGKMEKNFIPSGFSDDISLLYTLTEIFEFAARLAQKAGDSPQIF